MAEVERETSDPLPPQRSLQAVPREIGTVVMPGSPQEGWEDRSGDL